MNEQIETETQKSSTEAQEIEQETNSADTGELEKQGHHPEASDDELIVEIGKLSVVWDELIIRPDGTRQMRRRALEVGNTELRLAMLPVVLLILFLATLLYRPDLVGLVAEMLTRVFTRAG